MGVDDPRDVSDTVTMARELRDLRKEITGLSRERDELRKEGATRESLPEPRGGGTVDRSTDSAWLGGGRVSSFSAEDAEQRVRG